MDKNQLHNEKELVSRLAQGDVTAYDTLFRFYWDRIYSAAFLASRSADFAADVAQEVFLWVWKEKERMAEVENVSAYLYGATRNFILRKLKRFTVEENYRRTLIQDVVARMDATPETSTHLRELQQLIERGIQKLPPQQQRAFRLSREQGLSHVAIGQQMGLSENTIKDYIVKALAFLRRYLILHGDELLVYPLVFFFDFFLS